jgi:hypothetical protein
MVRICSFLLVVFFAGHLTAARAGDFPGNADCPKGQDCSPDQGGPQDPEPQPLPSAVGFCGGLYEGYYSHDPMAPVTFSIQESQREGDISVTAWWRGSMWHGQGFCHQTGPYQAAIEIYFPGAPAQRGMINSDGQYSILDGQIDGGPSFHLRRTN